LAPSQTGLIRKKKAKLTDDEQEEIVTWDASAVLAIAHETVVVGGAW
jgi:hypothetical protein